MSFSTEEVSPRGEWIYHPPPEVSPSRKQKRCRDIPTPLKHTSPKHTFHLAKSRGNAYSGMGAESCCVGGCDSCIGVGSVGALSTLPLFSRHLYYTTLHSKCKGLGCHFPFLQRSCNYVALRRVGTCCDRLQFIFSHLFSLTQPRFPIL